MGLRKKNFWDEEDFLSVESIRSDSATVCRNGSMQDGNPLSSLRIYRQKKRRGLGTFNPTAQIEMKNMIIGPIRWIGQIQRLIGDFVHRLCQSNTISKSGK